MVSCVCCSQFAPKLLVHVSLLLAIVSGAGLTTLARLKWDPSTYLIVRGLFPTEYRVLSGVLCFGTFLLVVLAHVAVVGMSISRGSYQYLRRAIFFTYAAMMTILIIVELVTVCWLWARLIKWQQSSDAKLTLDILRELKDWSPAIQKILKIASYIFKPLIVLHDSMKEVTEDLPYNLYVAFFFVGLVAILQPIAVILGVNAAYTYSKGGDSTKIVHTIRYNSNINKNVYQPTDRNNKKEFKHKDNYLSAIKNDLYE